MKYCAPLGLNVFRAKDSIYNNDSLKITFSVGLKFVFFIIRKDSVKKTPTKPIINIEETADI